MTGKLTPALREKLVKMCSRLGSDHDGERAAAALLVSRLLAAADLSWSDVILAQVAPVPDRGSPPPGWGPPTGWEEAFKSARANVRKPRRPAYSAADIKVMERIRECCNFINANTDRLMLHEREGYIGLMRSNLNDLSARVRKDALTGLEYLVGVIRRRQEEAAA